MIYGLWEYDMQHETEEAEQVMPHECVCEHTGI